MKENVVLVSNQGRKLSSPLALLTSGRPRSYTFFVLLLIGNLGALVTHSTSSLKMKVNLLLSVNYIYIPQLISNGAESSLYYTPCIRIIHFKFLNLYSFIFYEYNNVELRIFGTTPLIEYKIATVW